MIKIDFDDTFNLTDIAPDLSFIKFKSLLKNGDNTLLKAKISKHKDPLLANVYNLCFGPVGYNDQIDDKVQISHKNINKLFSTILLFSLSFLEKNPGIIIGVDGSNDTRAYLYHRMFITNKEYLDEYFNTLGVDWYVKLLRKGIIELDHKGNVFFKPKPEPFDYQRPAADLYRYYMFYKKV